MLCFCYAKTLSFFFASDPLVFFGHKLCGSSGSNFTWEHWELLYSYICQKLRLYVKVKIVFEVHKDPTFTVIHFLHVLPCNLEMVGLTNLKLC